MHAGWKIPASGVSLNQRGCSGKCDRQRWRTGPPSGGQPLDDAPLPLVIATMHREEGITGVQTHVRQLRQYLDHRGTSATLLTPFSWGRPLTGPVFGPRLPLERCSGSASVAWYRYWHEVFLQNALRRRLAGPGRLCHLRPGTVGRPGRLACTARAGQRVVMAVHFRISQADEWADKGHIKRDGTVFRSIRQLEREVIPQVDGAGVRFQWAREALVSWLPEAAAVPYAVIVNFVAPLPVQHVGACSATWLPSGISNS